VLDLLPSDDCVSADATPPLEAGHYVSTTAGLTNDYSSDYPCVPWSLSGADAVYRVAVQEGETLIAVLDMPAPADGALALLSDCGTAASAMACADTGLAGDLETLAFTAPADGIWYLVVDAWTLGGAGAFSSPWSLELRIERDVIEPGWIVPGTTQSFTLFGDLPWEGGLTASDIDLGEGLGIDAVAPGATPDELDFLASANPAAVPGPRTIEVDNGATGTVTFEDALWVTGWPVFDSCTEAASADPLAPSDALGFAVRSTDTLDGIPCMPYPSAGPEVLLPFDLVAGQSVTIDLTLPNDDAQLYILSDCADVAACFDDAAVDDTLDGEEESISGWIVPATGRYYVVIDVYAGVSDPLAPWPFDLRVTID
jgi:hypothetical protein